MTNLTEKLDEVQLQLQNQHTELIAAINALGDNLGKLNSIDASLTAINISSAAQLAVLQLNLPDTKNGIQAIYNLLNDSVLGFSALSQNVSDIYNNSLPQISGDTQSVYARLGDVISAINQIYAQQGSDSFTLGDFYSATVNGLNAVGNTLATLHNDNLGLITNGNDAKTILANIATSNNGNNSILLAINANTYRDAQLLEALLACQCPDTPIPTDNESPYTDGSYTRYRFQSNVTTTIHFFTNGTEVAALLSSWGVPVPAGQTSYNYVRNGSTYTANVEGATQGLFVNTGAAVQGWYKNRSTGQAFLHTGPAATGNHTIQAGFSEYVELPGGLGGIVYAEAISGAVMDFDLYVPN